MLIFVPLSLKGDGGYLCIYLTMFFVRLSFANPSLILRSERLIPVSFLYRLYIYIKGRTS